MQAREQKAVGSEIRQREQRIAELTEARDDMLNAYGKAERVTMLYQDMLDDAHLELMRYKEQFGLGSLVGRPLIEVLAEDDE